MKRKIVSILLAIACVFSLGIPVYAGNGYPVDNSSIVAADGTVEPQGFSRTYTKYLSKPDYTEIMSDTNWYGETTVTVTFKSSEGPETIYANIYIRKDSSSAWRYHDVTDELSIGDAGAFSLPDGYQFKVSARREAGSNGNATINVALD